MHPRNIQKSEFSNSKLISPNDATNLELRNNFFVGGQQRLFIFYDASKILQLNRSQLIIFISGDTSSYKRLENVVCLGTLKEIGEKSMLLHIILKTIAMM